MRDYDLLQNINKHYIKQDDEHVRRQKELLIKTLEVVTTEMKRQSPVFDKLFQNIYYSGSAYDDLQVGSCTSNDFDLNVRFKFPLNKLEIVGMGSKRGKLNFAYLMVTSMNLTAEEMKIVDEDMECVSARKMFRIMETACDQALTRLCNQLHHKEFVYRIGRSVGAPLCLEVTGNGEKISIDLVPSIEFKMSHLPAGEVRNRVEAILRGEGEDPSEYKFMAIGLWKAESQMFEIDFHDVERRVLYNKGCVKTVIRLLKLMRNKKGGAMNKSWSHLIKTIVMHEVLVNKTPGFWNESRLVELFIHMIRAWSIKFNERDVPDLFVTKLNLMGRLKSYDQATADTARHLTEMLRRYEHDGNLGRIFPSKDYLKAYNSFGPGFMQQRLSVEEVEDDRSSNRSNWVVVNPTRSGTTLQEGARSEGGVGLFATGVSLAVGLGLAAAFFGNRNNRN